MRILQSRKSDRRIKSEATSAAPLATDDLFADQDSETTTATKTTQPRKQDEPSDYARLFATGLRLLSMREHSQLELQTKLKRKTESADLVAAVLDELRAENYQSENRFTESFVRSRRNRGMGPIKIRAELTRKGVSKALIDEHLGMTKAHWFESATQVYQRKYGDNVVATYSDWSKRARFLQSRGFTSEQIQDAIPQPLQSSSV